MFSLSIAIGYSNKRFFAAMVAAWFASWLDFAAMAETNQFDQAQLDYNLKTSLGAYEKVGLKDARWDADVKATLETYSRMRAITNGDLSSLQRQIDQTIGRAMSNGCTDPLLRYLHYRYEGDVSTPDNAAAFIKATQAVEKSEYPEIRKFWASIWGFKTARQQDPKLKTSEALLTKTATYLAKALEDKSVPLREADQTCTFILDEAWTCNSGLIYKCYHIFESALEKNWGGTVPALLCKGKAYIDYAWQARGSGYADTVTDNGWKLMRDRLEIAASALEKAWTIDPRDIRICQEMIRVELGQGEGRDRMELWFERGMKIDPANRSLCMSKMEYLRPRWYGSAQEMIAFGRACTANTNYVGEVRLMLADAYLAVAQEIQKDEDRRKFWEQPKVWADIKNTFEQFFKLYPNAVDYRHGYAKYAARCCQAQAFLDQVKLFPCTNYTYFGGIDQFNSMVKSAQEHLK